MLTEILIKPYLDDLERQGIEDTTPYEQGFMAGMAALSDILSENIDNQPQLFTYLGMAISEGMQWIESQVSESPEKPQPIEFVPQPNDPRWIIPNDDYVGYDCYGMTSTFGVCKGVLNRTPGEVFYIYQFDGYEFGVEKIIPLQQSSLKCEGWLELCKKESEKAEQGPRERQPTPSGPAEPAPKEDWDYMPSHDDLEANFIQKYAKQKVIVRHDWSSPCLEGQTGYDLSGNRLQVIDMSGNQVKRPYYIKLR